MRRIALVLILLGLLPAFVLAQENRPQMPKEGFLIDISKVDFGKSPVVSPCSKYFRYDEPNAKSDIGLLVLVMGHDETKPTKFYTIIPWGTDKFQIRFSSQMTIPYVKMLQVGSMISKWAEIQITKSEYDVSPCLKGISIVQ